MQSHDTATHDTHPENPFPGDPRESIPPSLTPDTRPDQANASARSPQPPLSNAQTFRSHFLNYVLPPLLLIVSAITTTAIGARYMQNFRDGLPTLVNDSDLWPWPWLIHNPDRFTLGWPFSLTLLVILLAHEFGHYFACRYHGIRATLPWVLPAPTLSGTAGAVIQLRGRITTRQALMDIGAYGPIAGYFVSILAVACGLWLSHPAMPDRPHPLLEFGQPLTINLMEAILSRLDPAMSTFQSATRHPVLIAGWVGLFITAMNLLPGGQLDGGHILYAISPRTHRIISRLLPVALILGGLFYWVGWFFWAAILLIPAMRHPKVIDDKPLNRGRLTLAAVAAAILILTFVPSPFSGTSLLHYIR